MNAQNPERARKQKLQGLIIKSSLFGEGHRLITLIEKEKAKVDIMAFGAGKEKSSRRSAILAGHIVGCEVQRRDQDQIFSLQDIHVIQRFPVMTQEYQRISWFYLIAEILDVSLDQDSGFSSYDFLIDTLRDLDSSPEPGLYSLLYLFHFLREEGVFPHYSEHIGEQLREFSQIESPPGRGSLRFLNDSEKIQPHSFWEKKRLSAVVMRELLDLIVITVRVHFHRTLRSIELIRF